jgi:hypothetical protein
LCTSIPPPFPIPSHRTRPSGPLITRSIDLRSTVAAAAFGRVICASTTPPTTTHRWLCRGGNTSAPISYLFSISLFFLFSSSMRRLIQLTFSRFFFFIFFLSPLFLSPFIFIDIYLFVLSIRSLIAAGLLLLSPYPGAWVKKTNERKRGEEEVPSGVCHLWCRSSHSNWFDGRFPPSIHSYYKYFVLLKI